MNRRSCGSRKTDRFESRLGLADLETQIHPSTDPGHSVLHSDPRPRGASASLPVRADLCATPFHWLHDRPKKPVAPSNCPPALLLVPGHLEGEGHCSARITPGHSKSKRAGVNLQ